MYEYFNTPSKHFVGSRNPFLVVFVWIWHFNSISSHFNIISLSQKHWEDAPAEIEEVANRSRKRRAKKTEKLLTQERGRRKVLEKSRSMMDNFDSVVVQADSNSDIQAWDLTLKRLHVTSGSRKKMYFFSGQATKRDEDGY